MIIYQGSFYIMTYDLAELYYNKYLTFYRPPFSIWLEDVYIGLLASEFKTPVNNLRNTLVPEEQYHITTKEIKKDTIIKKGVGNTLFIYEKHSQTYIWNFLKTTS